MILIVSLTSFLFGLLLVIYPMPLVSYFTYPFIIWGIIGLLDTINKKRWGISFIYRNPLKFWGIIVPSSVIFWLFFEFTNLVYIQWDYLNIPHNKIIAVLLTFLSFSTVIPLVIQILWLLKGPVDSFAAYGKKNICTKQTKYGFASIGFFLLVFYLLKPSFWAAQTMWLVPFFIFFPFIPFKHTTRRNSQKFLLILAVSILISGLIWESFNYWAQTKWQYLIFPNSIHLFAMPLFGYIGYIPFIFSLISIFLFINKTVTATSNRIVISYGAAIFLSFVFIWLYFARFHV